MTISFVDPSNYAVQLDKKIFAFKKQLQRLQSTLPNIEVFSSPPSHYRLRAEFRVWHEDRLARYAMTDPMTKKPIFLDQFPAACKTINRLMPKLISVVNRYGVLREKLFQVEFLSTLEEDTLITLIYHRPLEENWIQAATALQADLSAAIVGRSRKQKIVLTRDWVQEVLRVAGRDYRYRQMEGSFSQPNGRVCEQMLSWAVRQSEKFRGDLLELYCGNGNFTVPLAQNFRRILATEVSKSLVKAALYNLHENAIKNVAIVRMSSEEIVQAMDGARCFRRLNNIHLDSYDFSTIFVDPPRAGLDEATLAMIQRFDQIVYISCNPSTLTTNLQFLCGRYQMEALAAFDQFPYTHHLEAGVILRKI